METAERLDGSMRQATNARFLLAIVIIAAVGLIVLGLASYADGDFRAAPAPGPSPTTAQERVVYLARSGGVTVEMATDSQILSVAQESCRAKTATKGNFEQMAAATRRAVDKQGIKGADADEVVGIVGGAAVISLCPDSGG